jgi:hypothetical protein
VAERRGLNEDVANGRGLDGTGDYGAACGVGGDLV